MTFNKRLRHHDSAWSCSPCQDLAKSMEKVWKCYNDHSSRMLSATHDRFWVYLFHFKSKFWRIIFFIWMFQQSENGKTIHALHDCMGPHLTSCVLSTLEPDTSYAFRLSILLVSNESPRSNTYNVRTKSPGLYWNIFRIINFADNRMILKIRSTTHWSTLGCFNCKFAQLHLQHPNFPLVVINYKTCNFFEWWLVLLEWILLSRISHKVYTDILSLWKRLQPN